MAMFGRKTRNQILDVHENTNLEQWRNRFTSEVVYNWTMAGDIFKEIPYGVIHNAIDNGDGTYTNPDSDVISDAASEKEQHSA